MLAKRKPVLGTHPAAPDESVTIDVDRLIKSRLLIQANSGGGKSWTIRRLLEETFAWCQHIVLDVDGEFHSLRERFDYALAGKGGDTPADLKSAALLARRLLELRVSCIVDIYELGARRAEFVKLFLESLVDAPRDLWHPVIVVVDEAHMFCPEKGRGEAASTAAVVDLLTRGRKRGFCAVLATQRISKLNKDAAAECNNKLIGRTGLDVDRKRAGEELGFTTKEELLALRKLPPGTFYAFGPAISDEVVEVKIGAVQTSHAEAGAAAAPPTPPRERIAKVLGELANLPHEAEAEARTSTELRAQVSALERELRAARAAQRVERREVPVIEPKMVTRLDDAIIRARSVLKTLENIDEHVVESARGVGDALRAFEAAFQRARAAPEPGRYDHVRPAAPRVTADGTGLRTPSRANGAAPGEVVLAGGERKILNVLAQYHPQPRTKQQVAILTGYAHSGGGFNNYLGSLRTGGHITGERDSLRITEAGLAALGPVEPLPTGRALFDHWCRQLGKAEREILRVLYEEWPEARPKEFVAMKAGYQPNGGGFNNALSRLRTLELIEGKARLRASDALHEVG